MMMLHTHYITPTPLSGSQLGWGLRYSMYITLPLLILFSNIFLIYNVTRTQSFPTQSRLCSLFGCVEHHNSDEVLQSQSGEESLGLTMQSNSIDDHEHSCLCMPA